MTPRSLACFFCLSLVVRTLSFSTGEGRGLSSHWTEGSMTLEVEDGVVGFCGVGDEVVGVEVVDKVVEFCLRECLKCWDV